MAPADPDAKIAVSPYHEVVGGENTFIELTTHSVLLRNTSRSSLIILPRSYPLERRRRHGRNWKRHCTDSEAWCAEEDTNTNRCSMMESGERDAV